MARWFTIAEAEQLLPYVEVRLREAQAVRHELQAAEGNFQHHQRLVALSGGSLVNLNRVFALRDQRKFALERLKGVIERLHQIGCRLRDLDLGLIEFPTVYRDAEVLLCWRPEDGGIRYWYGPEDSYKGRREIDEEFRAHHRGGAGGGPGASGGTVR